MLRLVVDADRAVLGSGPHCELRLPPDLVAREQLVLVAAGGTVRFEVRSQDNATCLRGVVASAGELGPTDVLHVGTLTLTAVAVSLSDQSRRFPLELLALVPAVLVLVLALNLSAPATAAGLPPNAPPLFQDDVAICSALDPPEAGHIARQRQALAHAKWERGPFSAADSVEAVSHFRAAAACFRVAGDEGSSHAAAAKAGALRSKLEDEYLTRRTRLEHAFVERDTAGIHRELPWLVSTTAHLGGPYVNWLEQEMRRANIDRKKVTSALR